MFLNRHVPSTSTLPAPLTRTLTRSSDGSEYARLVGVPSGLNEAGWHGQSSTPLPPFHESSQGRSEQIDDTAFTVSPRRNKNAPTAPAVTRLPWPSTKSSR